MSLERCALLTGLSTASAQQGAVEREGRIITRINEGSKAKWPACGVGHCQHHSRDQNGEVPPLPLRIWQAQMCHRGDVPISHRLHRTITQADRFAKSPLCPVLLFGENLEKKRSWWMSITLQNLSPSRALFITWSKVITAESTEYVSRFWMCLFPFFPLFSVYCLQNSATKKKVH